MAGTGRPDDTVDERALALSGIALLGELEATYPGDVDERAADAIPLRPAPPDVRLVDHGARVIA
jgi:hypothetical protein